ncbi:hypothetical protein B0H16DRAFT_1373775, partial [Mycena metata]
DNPHHLWVLHFLFLNEINKDCDEFRNDWNNHPISRKGHNQTPSVCVITYTPDFCAFLGN